MEIKINGKTIRVIRADITTMAVEGIVYYASPDLQLGTGFGSMISRRGGGAIQNELNAFPLQQVGNAVITTAGKLKADYVIHAVGPAFKEADIKSKLKRTVENALRLAEEKGLSTVAFPAMGTGFHGIPTTLSAETRKEAIADFLKRDSCINEIVICVNDPWVAEPYCSALAAN